MAETYCLRPAGRAATAAGRPGEALGHAKDALRAEHGTGRVHVPTVRDLLLQLRFLQRQIRALPQADAQARADARYLAGRGAMAVELGRPGAARREPRRLRALAGRYAGTHVT
ncbi:hypothetical protein [Streptomyces yangpuensis]|uniref:hypothetical protein n=1 Tax=Streptomyces yangpuensis TaxID=1648182 RepID=UPI00365F3E5E